MNNLYKMLGITLVVSLLFCLIDCCGGKRENRTGVVIDKFYKPSSRSYSTDSKGRTTSTYHCEEFYIYVRTNGRSIKVTSDDETFFGVEKGETLNYHTTVGCMSNVAWGFYANQDENTKSW